MQIAEVRHALGKPRHLPAEALRALHEPQVCQCQDHRVEGELIDIQLLRRHCPQRMRVFDRQGVVAIRRRVGRSAIPAPVDRERLL